MEKKGVRELEIKGRDREESVTKIKYINKEMVVGLEWSGVRNPDRKTKWRSYCVSSVLNSSVK